MVWGLLLVLLQVGVLLVLPAWLRWLVLVVLVAAQLQQHLLLLALVLLLLQLVVQCLGHQQLGGNCVQTAACRQQKVGVTRCFSVNSTSRYNPCCWRTAGMAGCTRIAAAQR